MQICGMDDLLVDKLRDSWQKYAGLNDHIITENLFTGPQLLRSLIEKEIATAGTVRLNRMEHVTLLPVKEMEKLERGSSDVVIIANVKTARNQSISSILLQN